MSQRPACLDSRPVGSALLWLLALGLLLAALWQARAFYHDDAFITLRYAAHVLSGHGVRFNEGEAVEGFSHPLWLLQLCALGWLEVDLEVASRLLGLIYLLGGLLLWARARLWPLPLLLLVTVPGVSLWSLGGLETMSYCFYLGLGAGLAERAPLFAGLALSAAALTRPEGAVVALAIAAWLGLRTGRTRPVLIFLGALLVPLCGYLLWRLWYFGDLLPSSVRAKATGLPPGTQVEASWRYLRDSHHEWLYGALGALTLVRLRGVRQAGAPLCAGLVLGMLVLGSGGDNAPGARFVVPAVVLLAVAAAWQGPPPGRSAQTVAGVLVALVAGFQLRFCLRAPAERNWAAAVGEQVGRFLDGHLPAGALVAGGSAGATAYFSPHLRFLDTAGLADAHIARRQIDRYRTRWQRLPGHHKGDGAYVLRRAPDVVIVGPSEGRLGGDPTAWLLTDFELLTDAAFHARYRPYRFAVPVAAGAAGHPALRRLLRGAGPPTLLLSAYLRRDSARAAVLATAGTPEPGS